MLYNKHNLAVAKIASKYEHRQEIAGVLFTKDKTVATDSFKLLEVEVDKTLRTEDFPSRNDEKAIAETEDFIIPAKDLKTIKLPNNKKLPVINTAAIVAIDENEVQMITTSLEVGEKKYFRRTKGEFPDYKAIIPTTAPVVSFSVNAKYLIEILSVMEKMGNNGEVKIEIHGENKPIMILGGNENQKARGLVMPIRK